MRLGGSGDGGLATLMLDVIAYLLLALVLFVLWRLARAMIGGSRNGCCGRCGYELGIDNATRCPECGTDPRTVARWRARSRSPVRIVVWFVVLMVVALAWRTMWTRPLSVVKRLSPGFVLTLVDAGWFSERHDGRLLDWVDSRSWEEGSEALRARLFLRDLAASGRESTSTGDLLGGRGRSALYLPDAWERGQELRSAVDSRWMRDDLYVYLATGGRLNAVPVRRSRLVGGCGDDLFPPSFRPWVDTTFVIPPECFTDDAIVLDVVVSDDPPGTASPRRLATGRIRHAVTWEAPKGAVPSTPIDLLILARKGTLVVSPSLPWRNRLWEQLDGEGWCVRVSVVERDGSVCGHAKLVCVHNPERIDASTGWVAIEGDSDAIREALAARGADAIRVENDRSYAVGGLAGQWIDISGLGVTCIHLDEGMRLSEEAQVHLFGWVAYPVLSADAGAP